MRAAEGLTGSVSRLLGLDLAIPDHFTLSRWAETLTVTAVQRRARATDRIVATALTTNDVDDGSQVGPLVDQIDDPIASMTGDGALRRRR